MKTDKALQAFSSWDNHRKDCKATVVEGQKVGAVGSPRAIAHPCVYEGDKCPNGMRLYNNWRRAIGQPSLEVRTVEEG